MPEIVLLTFSVRFRPLSGCDIVAAGSKTSSLDTPRTRDNHVSAYSAMVWVLCRICSLRLQVSLVVAESHADRRRFPSIGLNRNGVSENLEDSVGDGQA